MSKKFIDLLKTLHLYESAKIVNSQVVKLNPSFRLHHREMLKFYSQFISKGDLCFDVGANMGNRTDIFLELGASIVAIEPQPVCYQYLKKKYKKNRRVIIVQKALGGKEGKAEMMICDASTISSLSQEWIKKVKNSGRFSKNNWDKKIIVEVTTLDKLIANYGKPVFCKIDVEGFELEVIKGLSKPIKFISFEFTPEYIDSTTLAIEYFSSIGMNKYNYSLGESMHLALSKWVDGEEMCKKLISLSNNNKIFGDVYVKNI